MTINIMQNDKVKPHLDGLEGYIRSQQNDDNDLVYILSRLHYV